jgi:hypothetical protein
MSKRRITSLLAFLVLISLSLIIAISNVRPSLDYRPLKNRLPSIIAPLQLTEIELRTHDPHLISQPFIIRFLTKMTGKTSNALATPESLTCILFEQPDGKRVWLSIRLSGESINSLVVWSNTNAESAAKNFQAALTKAFPDMSITLEPSQDAPPQKP